VFTEALKPARIGYFNTTEGTRKIIFPRDWIITWGNGEKYVCTDDIFKETYDIVVGDM